jgi:hypothetical protein
MKCIVKIEFICNVEKHNLSAAPKSADAFTDQLRTDWVGKKVGGLTIDHINHEHGVLIVAPDPTK